MKKHTIVRSVVASYTLLAVSAPGYAHIIGLNGYCDYHETDVPFESLIQALAARERAIYLAERPAHCQRYLSALDNPPGVANTADGYTIVWCPTGDFGNPTNPDWPTALGRIHKHIAWMIEQQDALGVPCECREYVHIVGYSDGASTIGGWLLAGAPDIMAGHDFMGAVILIDAVREYNCQSLGLFGCFPNTNTGATWNVGIMPEGVDPAMYRAWRNVSPPGQCGMLADKWAGHRIQPEPPWINMLLPPGICHLNVLSAAALVTDLVNSIDVATRNRIALDPCCVDPPIANECPDLDSNGSIDFEDYGIFELDWLGPNVVLGEAEDDLDLDGDVDLVDFREFQRIVAFASPVGLAPSVAF